MFLLLLGFLLETISVSEIVALLLILILICLLDGMSVGLAEIAPVGHCLELRFPYFGVLRQLHPVLALHLLDCEPIMILNRIFDEGPANDAAFQHDFLGLQFLGVQGEVRVPLIHLKWLLLAFVSQELRGGMLQIVGQGFLLRGLS